VQQNTKLDFTGGLWAYFGLTLAWSFGFWGLAALAGSPADSFPGNLLLSLGGGGPPVAAILLTLLDRDADRRRDYWRRIVDVARIPPRWFGVIFLTAPLTSLLAVLTHTLLSGEATSFQPARELLADPLGLLPFALGILLFGPLPEELGWRGFALDRLQARWNGLVSSLVLAAIWAAWHVPLFFIPGTYQNEIGFGSAGFWLFMAALVPETILITWVYNSTHRSTLAAILFHFMTNFTSQVLDPAQDIGLYRLGWAVVISLGALWSAGSNLSGKTRRQKT